MLLSRACPKSACHMGRVGTDRSQLSHFTQLPQRALQWMVFWVTLSAQSTSQPIYIYIYTYTNVSDRFFPLYKLIYLHSESCIPVSPAYACAFPTAWLTWIVVLFRISVSPILPEWLPSDGRDHRPRSAPCSPGPVALSPLTHSFLLDAPLQDCYLFPVGPWS